MSLLGKRKTRYLRYILYVRWFSVLFSERPPKNIGTYKRAINKIVLLLLYRMNNGKFYPTTNIQNYFILYIHNGFFPFFLIYRTSLSFSKRSSIYFIFEKKSFKTFSSCSKQYHTSNGTQMLVFFFYTDTQCK